MKGIIEQAFDGLASVSETDMALLHLQHQRMSCEEYTRLYENSSFYRDPKKLRAVAEWHWNIYHSSDQTIRQEAVGKLAGVNSERAGNSGPEARP